MSGLISVLYFVGVCIKTVYQDASFFLFCICNDVIYKAEVVYMAASNADTTRIFIVAEQAGVSLTWSQTPEDMFSRDGAH